MKTFVKIPVWVLPLLIPVAGLSQAVSPNVPVGTIEVNRDLLRSGTSPQVTWKADYPSPVSDVVRINEDFSINALKPVRVRVRVLGVNMRSGSQDLAARIHLSVDGENGWQRVFLGTQNEVNPGEPVYDAVLFPGTRMDFSLQGASDSTTRGNSSHGGDWVWGYPATQTSNPDGRMIGLTDSQVVPEYLVAKAGGFNQGFLSPYFQSDGQTVKIGPRDVLYVTELSNSSPEHRSFDMQDAAILVTFEEK